MLIFIFKAFAQAKSVNLWPATKSLVIPSLPIEWEGFVKWFENDSMCKSIRFWEETSLGFIFYF
jgi:hypothetical protein